MMVSRGTKMKILVYLLLKLRERQVMLLCRRRSQMKTLPIMQLKTLPIMKMKEENGG